jgi:hypothetical protein
MITHDLRWSLPRGNPLVPSRWQATLCLATGSHPWSPGDPSTVDARVGVHRLAQRPRPYLLGKPDGRFTVSGVQARTNGGVVPQRQRGRVEGSSQCLVLSSRLRRSGPTAPRSGSAGHRNSSIGLRAMVTATTDNSPSGGAHVGNRPRCANAACEAMTGEWWFVRVWHSRSPAVPGVARRSFPWKLHIGCSPPPRVGIQIGEDKGLAVAGGRP